MHARPAFLRAKSPVGRAARADGSGRGTLSHGVTSFESCMLLDNIVPPPSYGRPSESPRCSGRRSCRADVKAVACSVFRSFVLGVACLLFLCPLLVMYAESVGFVAEVCALSLMGAVVNAGSAVKYVVLAFWVVTYTANCYNTAYAKYMTLSGAVFAFIKRKLDDDIRAVTLLRQRYQKNTAFKYFTTDELNEAIRLETDVNLCVDDNNDATIAQHENVQAPEDSIEYVDGKLHWRVSDLILFVDRKDVPRMPVELFDRICEIKAPGCPGPVSHSLLQATVQLGYMLGFLAFVFAVVVTFSSAYSVSATNQLLVTLAGGFLPFVVRFVLSPRQAPLDLNSYTFEGRIHNIIRDFSHAWPVYDLSFERDLVQQSGSATNDDASPSERPTRDPDHVDLLITVREDFENIRSESQQTHALTRYTDPEEVYRDNGEELRASAQNRSSVAVTRSLSATSHQKSGPGGSRPGVSVVYVERETDVTSRPLREMARQHAAIVIVSDGHGANTHSEVLRSSSLSLSSMESPRQGLASNVAESTL